MAVLESLFTETEVGVTVAVGVGGSGVAARCWRLGLKLQNGEHGEENDNRAHTEKSVLEVHCGAPLVETDRW